MRGRLILTYDAKKEQFTGHYWCSKKFDGWKELGPFRYPDKQRDKMVDEVYQWFRDTFDFHACLSLQRFDYEGADGYSITLDVT